MVALFMLIVFANLQTHTKDQKDVPDSMKIHHQHAAGLDVDKQQQVINHLAAKREIPNAVASTSL
jgi:hypothetical protein